MAYDILLEARGKLGVIPVSYDDDVHPYTEHRGDALPRELSGGEAQRVAIARALAPGPTVLLMDEPTSALDPARRGALGETLRDLAREGRALLIATHDTEFAREYTDRRLVLSDGRIASNA